MASMPSGVTSSKPFRPGTTGWAAADLLDARIEAQWSRGRYEIVEGVLTEMPPAYFSGAKRLYKLQLQISLHQQAAAIKGAFANDVDVVIDERRVVRADAVWMTPDDEARQRAAVLAAASGEADRDPERVRLLVAPTLVIESLSPGHEAHDRRTKRKWYAEFGVPHYWLFDPVERSLDCLVLERGSYRTDQAASGDADARPSLFPGLVVALAAVWSD
jgi:Uma2 family endonuclease